MLRRSALNRWICGIPVAALTLTATLATPALAQRLAAENLIRTVDARTSRAPLQRSTGATEPARIVSSQIEIAGERARIQLELANGRNLAFTLRDDQIWAGGRSLGQARRGGAFDRAWRDLLTRGMDTPTEDLANLLVGWTPPAGEVGVALQREFMAALGGAAPGAAMQASEAEDASFDTVAALNRRIAELEGRLGKEQAEIATSSGRNSRVTSTTTTSRIEQRVERAANRAGRTNDSRYSPLRHIGRGLAGILSDLVILAIFVGIGFATVFFARKPLEAIADTTRNETIRAGLVGLAGTFLILPGYILGIVALAISIVGIPLLLAWLPLFWVVISVAALLGYLAIAHGIGERLAERRFYGGEWTTRTNSYYYVLTGLTALFALFIASHAVQMAGPWLGFIRGLLQFLAIVLTWAAFTIGFGAVLLTRAGTRPRTTPGSAPADLDMGDLFEEESHV